MDRLVLVTWLDSFGCSSSWAEIERPLVAPKPITCRSVGWLLHSDEQCVVIVPHIARDSGSTVEQGCGDMTIPTVAVVSIEDLVPRSET